MKVIAGLGNPGREYEDTPHNAGFAVVERLADTLDCSLRRSLRMNVRMASTNIGDEDVILLQPMTYMNNSGSAVLAVMNYRKISPEDLIVISDDADIQMGRMRIRPGGSSGGHKGLDSIISCLATDKFARVRIGIGRGNDDRDLVKHVLSGLSSADKKYMKKIVESAAEAVEWIVAKGVEPAMNRFNGLTIDV